MPERKRFFSLRPSLILPVGPKNLQITYSGQLTCMRKWYKASTSAVDERSMFQWPRLKSIISFTIAIVIIWKTGVIIQLPNRINLYFFCSSVGLKSQLLFWKTALERFEVNDPMTWATLHWRETLAPKNAHLVHFKSISSSNYHDWDHTLHLIWYWTMSMTHWSAY